MYFFRRENLRTMSARMNNMRKLLYQKLNILSTPGNWDHVLKSVGLFSFTGLNGELKNIQLNSNFKILKTVM